MCPKVLLENYPYIWSWEVLRNPQTLIQSRDFKRPAFEFYHLIAAKWPWRKLKRLQNWKGQWKGHKTCKFECYILSWDEKYRSPLNFKMFKKTPISCNTRNDCKNSEINFQHIPKRQVTGLANLSCIILASDIDVFAAVVFLAANSSASRKIWHLFTAVNITIKCWCLRIKQ